MKEKIKNAVNSFLGKEEKDEIDLKKIIKSDKSILERLDKVIIVENNKILLND